MIRFFLAGILLVLSTQSVAQPLRALLLTSPGVYHNYELQTQVLTQGIAEHVQIRFDVSLAETGRWQGEDFAESYDVVIYNICMADNDDSALIANMRRQTETLGIPAIVIHCTMHSFRDTDDWWPFVGLKTYRHDSLGEMRMDKVASHPVLTGIPDDWTLPEDELYINLAFEGEPLLRAVGEDSKQHTLAWLQGSGQNTVFGTTLGHSNDTIANPVFQRLIANGILYVTGNLDESGNIPSELTPSDQSGDVIDTLSAPASIQFLGADGQSCVYRQLAVSAGPCYIGCALNPFVWGEQADTCRSKCDSKLPSMDDAIGECMPEA